MRARVIVLVVLLLLAAAVLGALGAGGALGAAALAPPRTGGARRVEKAPAEKAPTEKPPGGRALREHKWDGPAGCYPRKVVAEGLRYVRAMPGYGPASPGERAAISAEAARISRRHGVELRAGQLDSMRTMELATAARNSGVRAQRHGEEIAREHAGGGAVLDIAAKYRLPPLSVLRQILIEGGRHEDEVRAMLADPARLPPRLAAEAPRVFEADLGSRQHAARIRAESQAYEDALGAHLRAGGLGFRTEAELRGDGKGGAARLTPDFLLTEPVSINGRAVHWIDAKDYMDTDSKLVKKGLARQAEKYTAAFGPGAFVFSGGAMCGSDTARRALVLDGSHVAAGATTEGWEGAK